MCISLVSYLIGNISQEEGKVEGEVAKNVSEDEQGGRVRVVRCRENRHRAQVGVCVQHTVHPDPTPPSPLGSLSPHLAGPHPA